MATPGRYVPRDSTLHRLDARSKLVAAVLLAAAAVAAETIAAQALLLGILGLAFVAARLPPALLGRGVRGALWLLGFVALANGLWSFVSRRVGGFPGEASVAAAADLVVLLLRLVDLLLLAALVTATTVPVDAAEALDRLLRPFARWRLPVRDLGLLLALALGFVPLFLREARALADAHRVKMGPARWGLVDRGRAAVPLVVPLLLGVLRRADELALALDARCYAPGAPRTSLVPPRFGVAEWCVLGVAAAALAAAWMS